MAEETWHAARLIPTSGISGAEEQERRATSAFLAVLTAVKEFGRAVLGPLGAPAGNVETYIEVPFKLGEKDWRPDGLIRVSRGSKSWVALVEVKTGKNSLATEQLEAYLDIAREQGFDAVVTISNEIPPSADQHPTHVDKRKLRKIALCHLSWADVLSTAVLQKEHRGVSDPDQAWILGELIRYLEHPKSGALEFDDMGSDWVGVREAVSAGTLRATDKTIADVVARFDALLRYASLHLGRRLGTDVTLQLNRKERAEPALRAQALRALLVDTGTLSGSIRIPDTVADIKITADLRSSKVTCELVVDAPKTGRPTTRVNWLARQLKDAPGSLRIEASALNQRGPGAAELLSVVREDPALLVSDPTRELRSFTVAQSVSMGTKRGRGRGAFIDSVIDAVDNFYETVVQNIKAWSAAPPKFREEVEPPREERSALSSTALSSQDGAEPVERPAPTVVEERKVGDGDASERPDDEADSFSDDAVDPAPPPEVADTTESSVAVDREDEPTPFAPVRIYSMPVSEDS
ncbi:hypothetical protein QI633_07860 [Nocardioides sp. QY071]|uniref:hypothetical protein n=1 Tax=Nocardioides sp. QY071 TaxID=3044187 RepID=UPI00249B6BC9|nr:hypothetical protein [Nocardioides sp. QY071]WGY03671.1 hypothetical protein QI633_07860 [Nocardioides sp. QY071]